MTDDPYQDYQENGSNIESVLTELADRIEWSQNDVKEKEAALEDAKKHLKTLQTQTAPTITEGLRGKIDLKDGRSIQIKEKWRAGVPAAKRQEAMSYLQEQGYGNIIKRRVSIEFGADSQHLMTEFTDLVSNFLRKHDLDISVNNSVHHASLESFVREKMAEGVDLDRSLLGIYMEVKVEVK